MFIGFCYGVDPSFTKDLRNWDEALVGLYTCLDERIRGRWLKGHDDVLFIRGCICLVAHLDFGRIGPQHVGKTCGASSHACWTLASKPNIQNLHQIHISYFTFEHYRFQPAMYLHLMICTTFLCLSLFHLPSFCRPASPEINLHIKQKKWFHKIKETLVDYCWLENAKYGGWRSCFFFPFRWLWALWFHISTIEMANLPARTSLTSWGNVQGRPSCAELKESTRLSDVIRCDKLVYVEVGWSVFVFFLKS